MRLDSKTIGEKTAQYIRLLWRQTEDFFYPPRCPVCDELSDTGGMLCMACTGRIQTVKEPVCKRCGKPLANERQEYCADCRKKKHAYRQGKAVFVYQGAIRSSMYRFKYAGRREYAAYYAKEAAKLYGDWVKRNQIEVIVPVPMYLRKRRQRGYNQAEVFARALGRELGLLVDAGVVRRVKNTVPQKELNDRERVRNLKNAFQLASDIVKYKCILLVDDIYTTGSTVDEVTEVLLAGGVQCVYYICISIGAGF
ncbi:MAG: ComF family protein [Roseburia sp.]|nr:ComF family protein [Roseburia sp.]